MCRAVSGNIKIASEFWHLTHEPNEPILAVAREPRFTLFLNWSADLIAAREAVNLGTVLRQSHQKVCQILQLLGDDVDDATFLLHSAGDCYIACS